MSHEAAAARELTLARIRRALAGVGAPDAGHLPPVPARVGPGGEAFLAEFLGACEGAGGTCAVVATHDEARRALDDLIAGAGAQSVLVSPDAADPPWSCGSAPRHGAVRFVTRSRDDADRASLLAADIGITTAAHGLADTGTLVVYASPDQHRLDSLVPPLHVVLLPAAAILPDLATLLARLAAEERVARHSAVTLITGPSKTADIELTLTVGVHGPRRLHVIVVAGRAPGSAGPAAAAESGA